jgi:hypothetical protein
MSLRIAVSIAALTLVAASCTSSAEAENDGPELGATSLFSADENAIARLIENLFRAINEEEEYAVYAMFTPHDTCRPADIADRLPTIQTGVSPESDLEVQALKLREVGGATSLSFDLVERQGSSQKELVFEEFFPVVFHGQRWRFDANVCLWADEPAGATDSGVRDELLATLTAAQAFYEESITYLATANDLRYQVSGLSVVDVDLDLTPGKVLWISDIEEALMIGQGQSGTWYCVVLIGAGTPAYGSASSFEQVATVDGCLSTASPSGW